MFKKKWAGKTDLHKNIAKYIAPRIFCTLPISLNLFNAKHMYTCDFFPKKMLIFMAFFTDMGLEWSQD